MIEKWIRVTPPDLDTDPLTLDFVRDQHLRVTNGSVEDAWIRRAIRSSLIQAQKFSRRVHLTETWDLRTAFPCGREIEFSKAPVQEVESITYVDANGETQTLGASPPPYEFINPSIDTNQKASIVLGYGESWPACRSQPYPVTIRLVLGYPDNDETPVRADIPEDILNGRLVWIGELYKQRTESVQTINNTPAMIRARDLWRMHKVY